MKIPRLFPNHIARLAVLIAAAGLLLGLNASVFAANILYVVNIVVDPVTPANAHDQEVYAHLVAAGHTVTLADDDTVAIADVTGQDLVLMSSSIASGAAGLQNISLNLLKTGRTSVISYEPGIYDELGMQTATTFGNAGGHISIGIATPGNPLAGGLTGVVQVVEDGTTATFSYSPAPPYGIGTDAVIIATNATVDVGRPATWSYDRGKKLADNSTVTGGRKVALFFNATTAPGVYNTNAYALFDAALAWALEPAPVLPIIASFKSPAIANAAPNAQLIVELEDGTQSVVQNSIVFSLNGTNLTNPTITRTAPITRISAPAPGLFAPGTTNLLRVVYTDTSAPAKTFTNDLTFVVANYITLPASFAYPISSADASAPGFKARVVQANTASGTLAGSELRAEAQLAGTLIDPGSGVPYTNDADQTGADPDGFFVDVDVINWNQNIPGGVEIGDFRSPNFPDEKVPGIPGIDGANTDNVAAEIITYLELQPGTYTFGVNSDDGFVASFGPEARDLFHMVAGRFDGTRGSADTTFSVVVTAAGLYSYRVLWYEGNGDSNLELFSVDATTGEKIPLNNRTNSAAIKTYRQLTTASRPYLSAVNPVPGAQGVAITNALDFTFVNGTATVNTNTIQVKLNGTTVPLTTSEVNGGTVHIAADPAGNLLNFTAYTVQLIYADTSSPVRTVTNEFTFTTIRRPIQQGNDGLAVVESEQFSLNTPQGQHQWQFVQTPAGYSGTGEMYAFPDAPGAVIETAAGKTTAPRLDFEINFVKTGTHYFWFRGSDGGGNSLNAGIDGDDPLGTLANLDNGCCGTRLVPGGTSYVWVGPVVASGKGTFEVPDVGVHTINIWMREDGQLVDKILITTNANFTPTGAGPDQSPRQGQQAPTISISSPTANQTLPLGNVAITVNAQDDGNIKKVEFFESGTKIGESTNAPFSFTWNNVTNGVFFLTARATDNEDLATTSASVKITVGTPPKQVMFVRNAAGSASDTAFLARLRARGYQVREYVDTVAQVSDTTDKDLLVISSTVGSGNVIKFAGVAKPVIMWETAAVDEFGIEGSVPPVNGLALANQTNIIIVDATHPLAAGLAAGPVTVYSSPRDVGTMASAFGSLKVVATTDDGTDRPALVAVETGDALNSATVPTAPARRVELYVVDTFAFTTSDGQKIVEAAIDWALGIQSGGGQPQITVSSSGNQINITWTNGGTLEWTGALGPGAVWTPITPSTGTYSEQMTQTARYFRVRK